MNEKPSAVSRHVWLLFADINTRLNLLVDECAHIQDTVFGFLEDSNWSSLNILKPRQAQESADDKMRERRWHAATIRTETYHFKSSQEATLLNLWNSIGSLAAGLDAVREKVKQRYEKYLEASEKKWTASGTELYWFISLRGELLHAVFGPYLKQIQHAHETLVQLIENMPGTLPGPLLMRRWASAAYVEFLSDYSRQVNWQTQDFIWRYVYGDKYDSQDHFDDWRKYQHLVHTWSHEPASLTRQHTLELKGEKLDDAPSVVRFQTIWSAYFYLEQPILFPLLYHECAHYHVDDQLFEQPARGDGQLLPPDRSLFKTKEELAELLKRLAKFQSADTNFWRAFVEEVFMDLVAIHLGGKGYLAALALYLVGYTDGAAFSRFDLERDEPIPLDKIGDADREVRKIWYPDMTPYYLWDARLSLAIEAYKRLYEGVNEAEDPEFVQGLEDLLHGYHESGAHVFEGKKTSAEHQNFWDYRTRVNNWVVQVCAAALKPHYQALRSGSRAKKLPLRDELPPAIAEHICRAVANYRCGVLESSRPPTAKLNDQMTRLEDVAITVRWELSHDIATQLSAQAKSGGGDTRFDKYTSQYASYMRNDGSSAFRLAYEALEVQKDLALAVAHLLDPPLAKEVQIGQKTWKELENALGRDFAGLADSADRDKVKHDLARKISMKRRLEQEYLGKPGTLVDLVHTRAKVAEILRRVSDAFSACTIANGQIRVGTLTLGVCRSVGHPYGPGGPRPLRTAVQAAHAYHQEALDLLNQTAIPAWKKVADFSNDFFPLMGDYSYVHYLKGNTPAERDCHPSETPKILMKPRLVMQVFGETHGLDPGASEHQFGRLSQLRFKYRWEWVDLLERLKEFPQCSPRLFLSSGWEDVILVLWFKDEDQWREVTDSLRLHHHKGLDSHTNILLRQLPAEREIPDNPSPALVDFLVNLDDAYYVGRTTGRTDVTVVWRKKGEHMTIPEFAGTYFNLGPQFWRKVGGITTSFEEPRKAPTSEKVAPEDRFKFEIASHILLMH